MPKFGSNRSKVTFSPYVNNESAAAAAAQAPTEKKNSSTKNKARDLERRIKAFKCSVPHDCLDDFMRHTPKVYRIYYFELLSKETLARLLKIYSKIKMTEWRTDICSMLTLGGGDEEEQQVREGKLRVNAESDSRKNISKEQRKVTFHVAECIAKILNDVSCYCGRGLKYYKKTDGSLQATCQYCKLYISLEAIEWIMRDLIRMSRTKEWSDDIEKIISGQEVDNEGFSHLHAVFATLPVVYCGRCFNAIRHNWGVFNFLLGYNCFSSRWGNWSKSNKCSPPKSLLPLLKGYASADAKSLNVDSWKEFMYSYLVNKNGIREMYTFQFVNASSILGKMLDEYDEFVDSHEESFDLIKAQQEAFGKTSRNRNKNRDDENGIDVHTKFWHQLLYNANPIRDAVLNENNCDMKEKENAQDDHDVLVDMDRVYDISYADFIKKNFWTYYDKWITAYDSSLNFSEDFSLDDLNDIMS